MANLQYKIIINASKEKVWDTMLGDATYREWAGAFMPGSYYKGSWDEGSDIFFLGPDANGDSGMHARIVKNKLHEFISMEHLAEVKGESEAAFNTEGGMFENYTFTEKDGATEVVVHLVNIPEAWAGMMNDSWPKALKMLKEIAEK